MADIETIKGYLFKDVDTLGTALTTAERDLKVRLEVCISKLLDAPMTPDRELVEFMMCGCNSVCRALSQSQAYRTMGVIRTLVGDMQTAGKQWQRYMLVEAAKDGYNKACQAQDWKAAASFLDKIGKYTRLDKDDEQADWSTMRPPSFEPTDDYTVVEGIEKQSKKHIEARRQQLRKQLLGEDVEDAHYTEVESDGDED